MSAQFHVHIAPASLLPGLPWEAALREAGFDLRLQAPLDLQQPASRLRCLYRGQAALICVTRAVLDGTAAPSPGLDPAQSLRLGFAAIAVPADAQAGVPDGASARQDIDQAAPDPDPAPALICAAVVCARLGGMLLDPAAPAPIPADQAIVWATDFEVLRDAEYRRAHGGALPPYLQARQRRRRKLIGSAAAFLAMLPLLAWLWVSVQHLRQEREDAKVRAANGLLARKYEEERRETELNEATRAAIDAANKQARAEAAAAERAAQYMSDAELAALSDADYAFAAAEAPTGTRRWLIGYRQPAGYYAFDAREDCGKKAAHRDPVVLFPQAAPRDNAVPAEPGLQAVTLPRSVLDPLRAEGQHLPERWTIVTTEGIEHAAMTSMAAAFNGVNGPCLYLLTAPFTPQKERRFGLVVEQAGDRMPTRQLALAFPGDAPAAGLQPVEPPVWLNDAATKARHRGEERAALSLLRGDARLRAQVAQVEARNQAGNGGSARVRFGLAGVQAFRATLAADRLPEDFHLYHYNSPDGVPMNLWALVRDADQKVLGVSPGGDEGGEVLLLGIADLDGDGVDELLVRQILYNDEDERLLLFKVEERGLRVFGSSSYMGI